MALTKKLAALIAAGAAALALTSCSVSDLAGLAEEPDASSSATCFQEGSGWTPYCDEAAEPAKKKPAEPKMTRAQKEAVESARSYLSSGHFSKRGLIQQLTSSYGEDFDKKDAVFAERYVNPDYNKEAVQAAKSYLDSGHFSRRQLQQQLESTSGEGFTHAQATHAVNKVY